MKPTSELFSRPANRIGFHYFPDLLHYQETDIQTWLPILRTLNASWLILPASHGRLVPEHFIKPLIESEIEPVLQLNLAYSRMPEPQDMETIFKTYADWGVRGVILGDRPNAKRSWHSSIWIQENIVEKFIEGYMPLANSALTSGLLPIIPPMEPAGSYWDTLFLQNFLEGIQQKGGEQLLSSSVLAAYCWSFGNPLNWGAGGPERWPEARPYQKSSANPDQCGFRAYEWYQSICQSVIGRSLPVILMGGGLDRDPFTAIDRSADLETQTQVTLSIGKLLFDQKTQEPGLPEMIVEPISDEVQACNFWLLSADKFSPFYTQAWFHDQEYNLPIAKEWINMFKRKNEEPKNIELGKNSRDTRKKTPTRSLIKAHPIRHYLLIPENGAGVNDFHLDVIRPFIKRYRPTVGFSMNEACLAQEVTVIGSEKAFPEEDLEVLRLSGCVVERISGDGMKIASILKER